MKNLSTIILTGALLTLLSSSAWAWGVTMVVGQAQESIPAVDFTQDADLVSWWNFENNLDDSMAANNDLSGTTTYSTSTLVKNGTYSKINTALQSGTRSDTNLSSGFPGKSTGGTYDKISVTSWFRYNAIGYGPIIIQKADSGGTNYAYRLYVDTDGYIQLEVYTTGTTHVAYKSTSTLSADTNYFIAATWDGSKVNVYRGTDSVAPAAVMTETERTTAMNNSASADIFTVGANYTGTSYIDELAIFKDGLTLSEVKSIWAHGISGAR